MIKNNLKEAPKKKTALELKQELLEHKKKILADVNKKIKDIEKKEREKRLKPYFKLVEKYVDKMSDKDLETMTNYIINRFGNK